MGQYWEILALDGRKRLEKDVEKLKEFFLNGIPGKIERLIAVPVEPSRLEILQHHSFSQTATKDRAADETSSSLCRLPPEIHHIIFEHCSDDLASVIFLGLTSNYYWDIARIYIVKHYVSRLGCWSGKRIINFGNFQELDDPLPPNLFQTEEEREYLLYGVTWAMMDRKLGPDWHLKETDEETDEEDDLQAARNRQEKSGFLDKEPRTLYESAYWVFNDERNVNLAAITLRSCKVYKKKDLSDDAGHRAVSSEEKLPAITEADFYPTDRLWILRNLTTHEYVRADAFGGPGCGPFLENQGLGTALLCRISWSPGTMPPGSTYEMKNPTRRLDRGVWAGHRFDITTMDRHTKLTRGQTWRDVSRKVVKEVNCIKEANGLK